MIFPRVFICSKSWTGWEVLWGWIPIGKWSDLNINYDTQRCAFFASSLKWNGRKINMVTKLRRQKMKRVVMPEKSDKKLIRNQLAHVIVVYLSHLKKCLFFSMQILLIVKIQRGFLGCFLKDEIYQKLWIFWPEGIKKIPMIIKTWTLILSDITGMSVPVILVCPSTEVSLR